MTNILITLKIVPCTAPASLHGTSVRLWHLNRRSQKKKSFRCYLYLIARKAEWVCDVMLCGMVEECCDVMVCSMVEVYVYFPRKWYTYTDVSEGPAI